MALLYMGFVVPSGIGRRRLQMRRVTWLRRRWRIKLAQMLSGPMRDLICWSGGAVCRSIGRYLSVVVESKRGYPLFAPEGYTPLADILKLVRNNHNDLREWSKNLVTVSVDVDQQNDADFLKYRASRARSYSFEDVFEEAFHEVLAQTELYACHPNHGVWRFAFPVLMTLVGYRHLLNEVISTKSALFDVGLDWPFYEERVLELVASKEDPWSHCFLEFPHTSPNLFFNRETYTIDISIHNEIDRNLGCGFYAEHHGYPFSVADIRSFQGWALCVETLSIDAQLQEAFRDKFARNLCRALFGEWFLKDYADDQPEMWRRFIGLEQVEIPTRGKGTVAEETASFKNAMAYLSDRDELDTTKADIKAMFCGELGERAFLRVWDRLKVEHPKLAIPGRRKKT